MEQVQIKKQAHAKIMPIEKEPVSFYVWEGAFGGILYGLIEMIYRGYTHFSMLLLGGICLVGMGWIGSATRALPRVVSMLLCTLLVLTLELGCGLLVNGILGLNVWDYSDEAFSLWGQICPKYGIFWFFLSLPALKIAHALKRVWHTDPRSQSR